MTTEAFTAASQAMVRRLIGQREITVQGDDLPSTPDPRVVYPRAAAVLSALVVPVVLLTAAGEMSPGFAYRDVVALSIALLAVIGGLRLVPWQRYDESLMLPIVAAQIIYVVSLDTMTGGGASPYFALYAPILALAGWLLRPALLAGAILLVGGSEIWRAAVISPQGGADQVTIALPFYGVMALLAVHTAHRLTTALVTIRRDQVQTAATLEGVRRIGGGPSDDPFVQLTEQAELIFGARAGVIAFQDVDSMDADVPTTAGSGYLRVPVAGARGHHALLQMWRDVPFADSEVRLAAILAGGAGKAADSRWLLDRVREEAERDSLTGLLNRRALDRDIEAATTSGATGASAATLFFVDVDGLKMLNDVHGHEAGDRTLQRIGEGLESLVRRSDRVYRFGGDEFAVLAYELDPDQAQAFGERLRQAPNPPWRRTSDEGAVSTVTLSIGIATCGGGDRSASSLLSEADAAMYRAKRSGGNAVRTAGVQGHQ